MVGTGPAYYPTTPPPFDPDVEICICVCWDPYQYQYGDTILPAHLLFSFAFFVLGHRWPGIYSLADRPKRNFYFLFYLFLFFFLYSRFTALLLAIPMASPTSIRLAEYKLQKREREREGRNFFDFLFSVSIDSILDVHIWNKWLAVSQFDMAFHAYLLYIV